MEGLLGSPLAARPRSPPHFASRESRAAPGIATLLKGAGSLSHSTGRLHSPCSQVTPVLTTKALFIAFLKRQTGRLGSCFLVERMQGN